MLSHDQEATLTLLGVSAGRDRRWQPLLVMDVGGGSSEVILVTPGADPVVGAFAVGSARLTDAVVTHDPPTGRGDRRAPVPGRRARGAVCRRRTR